jgi:hypothetical protein
VYLTASPEGYIPLYRLPLKTMSKECCFYPNAAFMSASPGSFMMPLKDSGNAMPIWIAGNSGLSWAKGMPWVFPLLGTLIFSHCDLAFKTGED